MKKAAFLLILIAIFFAGCSAEKYDLTIVVTSVGDGFSGTYKVDDGSTQTFSDYTLEDNIALWEKEVEVEDNVYVFASPGANATYISIEIYDGSELLDEVTDEGDTVNSVELSYEPDSSDDE